MNREIDRIRKTRQFLLQFVESLTAEQLNTIPAGFNNNIIWNIAHLTAVHQSICYIRAGLTPIIDEKYITPFKKGTRPEQPISEDEIKIIKNIFLASVEEFEQDFNKSIFGNYITWTTPYNVEIRDINDAVQFLLFHEGLHLGSIMALKRFIMANSANL